MVAAVDTALDLQSFYWVNLRVTDDILKAPLGVVNPVLTEEVVLDGVLGIGVARAGGIHATVELVGLNRFVEDADG